VSKEPNQDRALVLVADDDATMRGLMRGALERVGFVVEEAATGEQTISLFSSLQPDLILLDVLMPGLDGFDTCRAIRRLPNGEHVPILMVTGLDDTTSISRAYEAGATDFITKRINWTVLGYRTQYMLRASRTLAALRHSEEKNRALLAQATCIAEELRQAKDTAETADRAKTEFLATMSHELRTPIHVILGYEDLLLDEVFGPLSEEQLNALRRIRSNAQGLLELISAVLDVSQMAAGKLWINVQLVHPSEIWEQLKTETRELCEQSPLRFVWDWQEELPDFYTDPGKLKVIIKNLLGNAIKFTQQGTVTVSARSSANGVEICVADTGAGIPPESLSLIFQPFQQLDDAANHRYGGTGLGLHIVKRLLELLGGRIEVESVVGQGSTFRVWLPLQESAVE